MCDVHYQLRKYISSCLLPRVDDHCLYIYLWCVIFFWFLSLFDTQYVTQYIKGRIIARANICDAWCSLLIAKIYFLMFITVCTRTLVGHIFVMRDHCVVSQCLHCDVLEILIFKHWFQHWRRIRSNEVWNMSTSEWLEGRLSFIHMDAEFRDSNSVIRAKSP